MHGLVAKIRSHPGQRAALLDVLLNEVPYLPGCISYVVAEDRGDGDVVWITQVWDSRESEAMQLTLVPVWDVIGRADALIASREITAATRPLGGQGLPSASSPDWPAAAGC